MVALQLTLLPPSVLSSYTTDTSLTPRLHHAFPRHAHLPRHSTVTMLTLAPLLVLAGLPISVLGGSYILTENIIGTQFLSAFTHVTNPDATGGRVYVSFSFLFVFLCSFRTSAPQPARLNSQLILKFCVPVGIISRRTRRWQET